MLRRSIDRELGLPEAPADVRSRRDSWLRDWPLLLGLVLSAALIVGSISLGVSRAKPAAAQPEEDAPAVAVSGEVVDVGEPEPAAEPDEAPAQARKTEKKAAKSSAGSAADAPTSDTGGASAEDSPSSSTGSGGGSDATTRSPSRSSGGSSGGRGSAAPRPGRIVNVTGTSAAFNNGPLAYTFSAPTHTPTVGKDWVLQVSVKKSGKPMAGTVKIDILHGGSVVGHAATGSLKNGRFAHDFEWPQESVGHPLTIKTTILGGGFQQSFLFNVKVKSGR